MDIKQIIARKGSVLLSFLLLWLLGEVYIKYKYNRLWCGTPFLNDSLFWTVAILSIYCLYLLIRFILWAIRKAKKK